MRKKTIQWLYVGLIGWIGVVGFLLLLHDLDTPATGWSLTFSGLARVAGGAILYGSYRLIKMLKSRGKLPMWLLED